LGYNEGLIIIKDFTETINPIPHILCMYINIDIKSKGINQPENLIGNGSSRHDDAAQTDFY